MPVLFAKYKRPFNQIEFIENEPITQMTTIQDSGGSYVHFMVKFGNKDVGVASYDLEWYIVWNMPRRTWYKAMLKRLFVKEAPLEFDKPRE